MEALLDEEYAHLHCQLQRGQSFCFNVGNVFKQLSWKSESDTLGSTDRLERRPAKRLRVWFKFCDIAIIVGVWRVVCESVQVSINC